MANPIDSYFLWGKHFDKTEFEDIVRNNIGAINEQPSVYFDERNLVCPTIILHYSAVVDGVLFFLAVDDSF